MRRALALTFAGNEEVEIIDTTFPVFQMSGTRFVGEISRYNYLIEKIPSPFIGKCSYSLVDKLPPGIVEAVGCGIFGFLFATEHFCRRFVERVIIEVAHDNNALIGVDAPDRIGNLFRQRRSCLAEIAALFLTAQTRRPVVDDDVYRVGAELTGHAELIAGPERRITLDSQPVVGDIDRLELTRVVKQSDVDTAAVGAVVVDYLIHPASDIPGLDKILEHTAVLYLTDTDDSRPVRGRLRCHIGYGIGQIIDFRPIFVAVPLSLSARRELEVVFAVVVNRVEQVLKIIESKPIDAELLLGGLLRGNSESYRQRQRY